MERRFDRVALAPPGLALGIQNARPEEIELLLEELALDADLVVID